MKNSGRVYNAAYSNSNRDSDELLISSKLDNSALYNTSNSIKEIRGEKDNILN